MADLVDELDGPPIEQHGRTHGSTSSGMEIVRKFHVPKWTDFLSVQRALHGRVERKDVGGGSKWVRTRPLRDTYIKNAYCNQTEVDFAHPNALQTMPSLATDDATTIKQQLEDNAESLQKGTAGAIVTAHYRPLITAWRPGKSDKPDEDADLTEEDLQIIWDWIDPVFTPGVMQMPWPAGLHAAVDHDKWDTREVPGEAASPLVVPVSDLSIKRLLVGEVPWGPISQLAEIVNKETWPVDKSPAARGLGLSFPPETLKFIDADVTNMLDAEGTRWYEITLNFKWIHQVSNRRRDEDGKPDPGPVTWNHMFLRPGGFPVGWYRIFRSGTKNVNVFGIPFGADFLFAGEAISDGPLHGTGNFDNLFKLNQ